MHRALRVSLLVIAILAAAGAAALWGGRQLGLIEESVQWARVEPANPEVFVTMEQIEESSDTYGNLRGRVRRAAEGHFEVRVPKSDGTVRLLVILASLTYTGLLLLRARSAS